jgi:hypothetical protein
MAAAYSPYRTALEQGVPAYAKLANASLLAIEDGAAGNLEGLAAASLFARFAAVLDDRGAGDGFNFYAEVLLIRETWERQHGSAVLADWHGAEALRRLGQAADQGHEAANARLCEVSERLTCGALKGAKAWEQSAYREAHAAHDALAREAARGDAKALDLMMDEALHTAREGYISELESLIIAEQIGRLGTAAGHGLLAGRLAGVLMTRGTGHGDDLAAARKAESIEILGRLVATNHAGSVDLLKTFIDTIEDDPAPIQAALREPAVLAGITCKGAC